MDAVPVIPGKTLLYKYRPLETDQHVSFAADILLNHRLFCAPPGSFNDPFDCAARHSFDATEAEKTARAVARIQTEDPAISEEKARIMAPARYRSVELYGPDRLRSMIEDTIGVVSLSGTLDNLLLWAHYASAHTGISIEFRALEVPHGEFFGSALPVHYQEERPVIQFYRDDPEQSVRKALLTKSRDWEYEMESRILTNNRNQDQYIQFAPELITAVYLGCRISAEHRSLVNDWIRDRDCSRSPKLYQAKPSESVFALDFEGIS